MNDPTEIRTQVPLGELTGLQWGDPAAPALIALHGWLDNAASFTRLAPLLAAKQRVIALDLPGHGHSLHLPGADHRYHLVDQVDVVLEFADALRLPRFDLLGHSLGAGIATLAAAAAPARVGRLALIEGLGPLADEGVQTLTRWQSAYAHRVRAQRPARTFATIDAAVAARVAVGGLDPDEAYPIIARNLRAVDGGYAWRSDRRLRHTTPVRIEEQQLRRILGGVTAPALLILAEPASPYLPAAMMAARAACVRDIHVEHLAGPHHLHIRHPGEVAARIAAFLRDAR